MRGNLLPCPSNDGLYDAIRGRRGLLSVRMLLLWEQSTNEMMAQVQLSCYGDAIGGNLKNLKEFLDTKVDGKFCDATTGCMRVYAAAPQASEGC